jgi:hypothetical protein
VLGFSGLVNVTDPPSLEVHVQRHDQPMRHLGGISWLRFNRRIKSHSSQSSLVVVVVVVVRGNLGSALVLISEQSLEDKKKKRK